MLFFFLLKLVTRSCLCYVLETHIIIDNTPRPMPPRKEKCTPFNNPLKCRILKAEWLEISHFPRRNIFEFCSNRNVRSFGGKGNSKKSFLIDFEARLNFLLRVYRHSINRYRSTSRRYFRGRELS